ncbi:alcohol dehydrogenase yqhd [Anaeramoeba flamelloides]|uniref:Alcohol dehydrogenase yqhd n=1 Tax=Anaeramoeba flamelloides TaxID=1746091 RepID=A0ABQ8XAD1_9EUKA|nr:alcohol dehydrogenase yqhd [Anaeramoeba flamelloides]
MNNNYMNNFDLKIPTKFIFGKETIEKKLKDEIPEGSKVLMIYGGGSIKKNGVYDKVITALDGYSVTEFPGVRSNPRYEKALEAVKIIKEKEIDFLLAIGGGSVIDLTKFVALAAVYKGNDPWELTKKIKTKEEEPTKVMNFGCILTCPGTGTEGNKYCVISKEEISEKMSVKTLLICPKFSILDPETTFTLPWRYTRNGIIDNFIHLIERYTVSDNSNFVADRFAEQLMKILIDCSRILKENPKDYVARSNVMWVSSVHNMGLLEAGNYRECWLIHLIGHQLTVMTNADHGLTLACCLKGVWTHQKKRKAAKLKMLAENVFGVTEGTDEEKVQAAIEKTIEWFKSLGMPTTLSSCNITKEDFTKIGKDIDNIFMKKQKLPGIGAYFDIHGKEVIEILKLCDF